MITKTTILSTVITLLLLFLVFPKDSMAAEPSSEWLGIFTIESCPVKKCEILSIGEALDNDYWLRNRDTEAATYLEKFSENISACSDFLKKQAIEKGYNAILGYKINIASAFNGFGGKILNGTEGVGYGIVNCSGTPAIIKGLR